MARPGTRTLRRQLTLLYAGPFLVSGALLLLVPLFGASSTSPVPGQNGSGNPGGQGPAGPALPGQGTATGNHLLGLSAIALAVMVIVSIVLGWMIAGRFLRPLRRIIDTARDISATNLHRRLGPTGHRDEFAELAGTLDALFGRLEASFESQRHFVANASHELRTPLTAQRTLLQVALADPDASTDSLRAAGREVLALGDSQARLIDALLTLATGEQGVERPVAVDLAEVTRRVVDNRAAAARSRALTVTTWLPQTSIQGDESLTESLIANLFDNAVKHNVDGGRVDVDIDPASSTLTIINTGPVVPPDELARLFQPFQRLGTQRVRARADGYGLGLAIARAIAVAHDAELAATALPEGGLRVRVTFPPAGPGANGAG